jgi:hypothetical protein
MEVIGWSHALAALLMRKSCWVHIEYEARKDLEQFRTFWRRGRLLALAGF